MPSPVGIARSTIWFASASIVTTVLHELTHASVAYALGVRATLRNYSVSLHLTPDQSTTTTRVLIAAAGPLFCLALGLAAWSALKRARGTAAELPLIYFSIFGLGTFCGNLLSSASVGDFSVIALLLQLPMSARYAASVVGAFTLAALHFWAGQALARLAAGAAAAIGVVTLSAVLGTAAVILVNLPMASAGVTARMTESTFWIFAVIGAGMAKRGADEPRLLTRLHWVDGVVLMLAVLAVRLMMRGIPFEP
jgi:hypothetical protein